MYVKGLPTPRRSSTFSTCHPKLVRMGSLTSPSFSENAAFSNAGTITPREGTERVVAMLNVGEPAAIPPLLDYLAANFGPAEEAAPAP